VCFVKLALHDADTDSDTDILARILADTSDTRDFLKLLLWQAERHADILATILARMSARMSVSVSVAVSMSVSAPWNASFIPSIYGMQTYTKPVPLKYGELATKYPLIYGYFYSVCLSVDHLLELVVDYRLVGLLSV